MTTSRHRVLDYLRKTRSASVREIARALKMSAPNVRHHLSVLCSDGRAEVNEIRSRAGRGRPEKIYTLARSAMGDNLAALTNALLETAGKGLNLEAVAERILGADQFANLSVPKRLALLIARLNEMHYQAHWEAGAGGPRVIFGRCPYWKVIEAHPEICKMDAALVQKAMARPVSQLRKNESARGLCPFIFQIGE